MSLRLLCAFRWLRLRHQTPLRLLHSPLLQPLKRVNRALHQHRPLRVRGRQRPHR